MASGWNGSGIKRLLILGVVVLVIWLVIRFVSSADFSFPLEGSDKPDLSFSRESIQSIANSPSLYVGRRVSVSGILVFYGGNSNPAAIMDGDGYALMLTESCFSPNRKYEFEKKYVARGTVLDGKDTYRAGLLGMMTTRNPGILCLQPLE